MSSFAMAGRGPKARYYPGANSLAVFSAQGSNPLQDCKVYGKGVTKVYDKSVKGYVYSITGGLQSKLQLPKDDSKIGLQLLQSFLVLQVFVPQGVHFSFELRVSDISNTRRKMYFSTSFSDIKSTPLHCQIPISMIIRNKWLSLVFHVSDLFNKCFNIGGGINFRSVDVIVLGHVCKLRKIFTMRCRIMETDSKGYLEDSSEKASENALPHEHTYALGVDNCVQILDMTSIQSAMVCNREAQDHESSLSARMGGAKQQQPPNKLLENTPKVVHVAFGTRMPLPLSTVHINTSLPHDKCPALIKDRIGKVHFISDHVAAVATSGEGEGEANIKPLQNMISRTLNVASLDRERRSMVRTKQMGVSTQWCVEETEPATNMNHMVTTNKGGGFHGDSEPHLGTLEDSQISKLVDQGLESPKIVTQQQSIGTNVDSHVEAVLESGTSINSSTTSATSNKSPTKWVSKRKDVQIPTMHLKQQKAKDHRSKEYKHSRYMDSPPGSPPSGWDDINTSGRPLSEDTTVHDHFLEGSWMNNQLCESIDAESEKKSQQGDDEDSLMFDIHDDSFFPRHLLGKRKDMNGLETHSMANSFLSSIQGNDVGESFDFDAEPNTHVELESSCQDTTHEAKTSWDFASATMETVEEPTKSDKMLSWVVPNPNEHLSYQISSRPASQGLVHHEHEGSIKTNGRVDEDLDLLYDPTLDCYYDPKTNRYYELK